MVIERSLKINCTLNPSVDNVKNLKMQWSATVKEKTNAFLENEIAEHHITFTDGVVDTVTELCKGMPCL